MKKHVCLLTLLILVCVAVAKADELAAGFANPPHSASPHTFWHWMNGNVTKEGITADLEAMRQVGIGGAFQFQVEGKLVESVPEYIDPPVHHLKPQWFEMLRHAAAECKRLGLEFSIMNCTGWSTSGGPWVTPDKSMMRIVWSDKFVKGPGRIEDALPLPPCDYAQYQNLTADRPHLHESVPPNERFYRDAAVLAYRLDPAAARVAALWPPKMTCSDATGDPAKAVDGDGGTAQDIAANGFIEFDFGEAVTVRGVEYLGGPCELQASDDGKNWLKVAELPAPRQWGFPHSLPLPESKARRFRLLKNKTTAYGRATLGAKPFRRAPK